MKRTITSEEEEKILPILRIATKENERIQSHEYYREDSYWTDKHGWVYIKWKDFEENYAVVRYKLNPQGELIREVIKKNKTLEEKLRGGKNNVPVVLITGDTHGDFDRIKTFCRKFNTTKEDIIIILGDVGINYSEDFRDAHIKKELSALPITLFCIQGNHEKRPENIPSYHMEEWHGGKVYVENEYPSLIFGKDGEIYDIAGKKVIVIGGAYSVDKWYRLRHGMKWFEDEQPSDKTKEYVEKQLEFNAWNVDVVLSHTTPYQYRPVDLFIEGLDQSTVDDSTEKWLSTIEEKLVYEKWYAGHYHCDRVVDRLEIMFCNVEVFCENRNLNFSME